MGHSVAALDALLYFPHRQVDGELDPVFHGSSVTWSSRGGVEEIRTAKINLVGSFRMR